MLATRSDTAGLSLITVAEREEASLWRRLKETGDQNCRERLFTKYMPYARSLSAHEFSRRPPYGSDRTDFDQLAYFGLLQAVDRYDPASGYSFKTYARYRITGAISDGVLKSSEKASAYRATRRAEKDRLDSLRKESAQSEPVEALRDMVVNLAIGFLVESVAKESLEKIEDANASNGYESLRYNQMLRTIRDSIETIPDRERQVVRRHYFDDMTFVLIAELMRLTKGRISQIHKSAIERLRDLLKRNNGE